MALFLIRSYPTWNILPHLLHQSPFTPTYIFPNYSVRRHTAFLYIGVVGWGCTLGPLAHTRFFRYVHPSDLVCRGRPFQYQLQHYSRGCERPGSAYESCYHPAGSNLVGLYRLPVHRLLWNSLSLLGPDDLGTGWWTWWGYLLSGTTVEHESTFRTGFIPL